MKTMKKCSECGEQQQTEGPIGMTLPHGGLHFCPRFLGYYGGYWDNQPWIEDSESEYVTLCKNCTERLVREFPSILAKVKERWENDAEGMIEL